MELLGRVRDALQRRSVFAAAARPGPVGKYPLSHVRLTTESPDPGHGITLHVRTPWCCRPGCTNRALPGRDTCSDDAPRLGAVS